MREQIEALAMQGAPSVSSLIELDGNIEFQTQRVTSTVYNAQQGAIAYAEVPDALAVFAWTFKDVLIAKLDAEINAKADDRIALSHEARQLRSSELQRDLLAVERDEAMLIWRAQSEGLPIEFSSDTNPCALLGVELIQTPLNGQGGTSPEHAIEFAGAPR